MTQKASASQQKISLNDASPEDIEEMTINCVRYMIFRAGSGLPIKKTDLQQQITKNLKNLNVVIERTTVTLKEMYGYDLQTCDAKHNYYSIANSLPDVDLDSDESSDEEPEDVNKILILLILTHIFMSNGRVSEVSLGNFLKSFNIKVEQEHSLFGNVKHFINYLIKARYLCTEIEQGTQQTVYMWGSKAEKEISKLEILKFVANTYGGSSIDSWTTQYEEAGKQFENEQDKVEEEEEENMDTSEGA